MLDMIFQLSQRAEKSWRRLRGFDYLAELVIGIKFKDGIEVDCCSRRYMYYSPREPNRVTLEADPAATCSI